MALQMTKFRKLVISVAIHAGVIASLMWLCTYYCLGSTYNPWGLGLHILIRRVRAEDMVGSYQVIATEDPNSIDWTTHLGRGPHSLILNRDGSYEQVTVQGRQKIKIKKAGRWSLDHRFFGPELFLEDASGAGDVTYPVYLFRDKPILSINEDLGVYWHKVDTRLTMGHRSQSCR